MSGKRYVVDEKGEKKAVIVPIEEYEKLIEDLHDLALIAKRRDESTVPLDEIIEKLKKHGILPSSP
jgi:PHD/YefM family antitoxin component YafN of YafNO toxin-antitoxin module